MLWLVLPCCLLALGTRAGEVTLSVQGSNVSWHDNEQWATPCAADSVVLASSSANVVVGVDKSAAVKDLSLAEHVALVFERGNAFLLIGPEQTSGEFKTGCAAAKNVATTSSGGGGLSLGVIAGAAAGFLALVALLAVLLVRRRRRQQRVQTATKSKKKSAVESIWFASSSALIPEDPDYAPLDLGLYNVGAEPTYALAGQPGYATSSSGLYEPAYSLAADQVKFVAARSESAYAMLPNSGVKYNLGSGQREDATYALASFASGYAVNNHSEGVYEFAGGKLQMEDFRTGGNPRDGYLDMNPDDTDEGAYDLSTLGFGFSSVEL